MPNRKFNSLKQLYASYCFDISSLTRSLLNRLPPIEAIMEILVTKTDSTTRSTLKDEPMTVINDMASQLQGNTISYLEFSQGMCQSKTLLRDIYEPVFSSQVISKYE